ncbi:DUF1993 domain-containing protein [Aquincola sp. S2]|uniref:DUF1993 domain-containing protein n=1 Tax=Pseudaquabacterium terrae TaxID=2732868 RepID=A0ABX2EJI4_9BURK|nr:DUF1993 domain-containing protein [Aquabacterium terrae]NRF68768.1 DUF1993 domain-containing protein [Aquabacterium terrae]
MPLSMYSASVPVFKRQLTAMLGWLDKAEAHAQARKFDAANFLQARLAPDMLPFVSQIRIASDNAKGCVARLAGAEIPKFEDNEASLDELRQRIRKTLDYIASVPAEAFDGSDERDITLTVRNRDPFTFKGAFYLNHWALPNFFFHVTTAYALLRHNGVEVGKADFLALGS